MMAVHKDKREKTEFLDIFYLVGHKTIQKISLYKVEVFDFYTTVLSVRHEYSACGKANTNSMQWKS